MSEQDQKKATPFSDGFYLGRMLERMAELARHGNIWDAQPFLVKAEYQGFVQNFVDTELNSPTSGHRIVVEFADLPDKNYVSVTVTYARESIDSSSSGLANREQVEIMRKYCKNMRDVLRNPSGMFSYLNIEAERVAQERILYHYEDLIDQYDTLHNITQADIDSYEIPALSKLEDYVSPEAETKSVLAPNGTVPQVLGIGRFLVEPFFKKD